MAKGKRPKRARSKSARKPPKIQLSGGIGNKMGNGSPGSSDWTPWLRLLVELAIRIYFAP
ncbi:hypothetical protein DFR29_1255 [Tahibacter aquaticus]|uniref:Uncharacterized protein n=1 Tax=Tahibacter aquaticus TaxID=520092 RepID=A0A4V6PY84_9GAMM|nr:hypothetical protein [Tahibacter aquaticus]TDR37343.1 hypothetical protein DFR29_1255 [Tahibacter aquaticus]